MSKDFKGIWIPAEVWRDKNLTVMEKLFLCEIMSLDNNDGCYAMNRHFSEHYEVSIGRCSQIIKSLEQKKYLSIEYKRKGEYIIKRIIRVFNKLNNPLVNAKKVYNKCGEGLKEKPITPLEKSIDNNTTNTKKNNTVNKDSYYLSSLPAEINVDKWKEWVDYRKELKKPMTQRIAKKQITFLTVNIKDYIAIINKSIMNGWTGLFEIKENNYNMNKQGSDKNGKNNKDNTYGIKNIKRIEPTVKIVNGKRVN